MEVKLATEAPLFAFGDDLTIVAWNAGAEELTGTPAEEAIGQPCWAVLGGRDDDGGVICHRQCSRGRLAHEGRPLPCLEMNIRCREGRRRIAVDTIAMHSAGGRLTVHVMRDAPAPVADDADPQGESAGPRPRLTPRQLDVLRLLGDGISARSIASMLWLTEATVRNHIRAVLRELGAHSQLEAVCRARCLGLL
ncbi:MAG TPA: LuxR C-terminal-related transcriptional regulator [Gaiellaceae bacterium]|nr:LuxR C-terminal-related transcriptional regulator [Gaiellaceae bacterium]